MAIKTMNTSQASTPQGLHLTGKGDPPSLQGKSSSGQLAQSKAAYLMATGGIWSQSREPTIIPFNQARIPLLPGMTDNFESITNSTTKHPYPQPAPTITHSQLNPNCWLTAILRLLQNIAWDWWKYQNGIVPTGAGELLVSVLDTISLYAVLTLRICPMMEIHEERI